MKLQLIFFALIFYTFFACSEQKNQPQQIIPRNQHPTSLQIIIHNETQSGLDQNNALDQKAQHASTPRTTTETTVEQRQNDQKTSESCDNATILIASALSPIGSLAYYLYTKFSAK